MAQQSAVKRQTIYVGDEPPEPKVCRECGFKVETIHWHCEICRGEMEIDVNLSPEDHIELEKKRSVTNKMLDSQNTSVGSRTTVTRKKILEESNRRASRLGLPKVCRVSVGDKIGPAERAITVWVKNGNLKCEGSFHRTNQESTFSFPELEVAHKMLGTFLIASLEIFCDVISETRIGIGNEMDIWGLIPDE